MDGTRLQELLLQSQAQNGVLPTIRQFQDALRDILLLLLANIKTGHVVITL